MLVNLNQYRATVGVFNITTVLNVILMILGIANHFKIAVVSVIFMCLFYLVTLIVYLDCSLSYIIKNKSRTICGYLHIILHINLICLYVNHFWFFKIVLKLCGDVEENPGPKPSSSQSFSVCH